MDNVAERLRRLTRIARMKHRLCNAYQILSGAQVRVLSLSTFLFDLRALIVASLFVEGLLRVFCMTFVRKCDICNEALFGFYVSWLSGY